MQPQSKHKSWSKRKSNAKAKQGCNVCVCNWLWAFTLLYRHVQEYSSKPNQPKLSKAMQSQAKVGQRRQSESKSKGNSQRQSRSKAYAKAKATAKAQAKATQDKRKFATCVFWPLALCLLCQGISWVATQSQTKPKRATAIRSKQKKAYQATRPARV